MIDKEFLEHYGVKGMKWGVRRNRSSSPKRSGGDPKKGIKSLSDAELQRRVNRLNLEKQYSSLTSKSGGGPSILSRGISEVNSMVVNSGKQSIKNFVVQPLMDAIVKGAVGAVKKKVGG